MSHRDMLVQCLHMRSVAALQDKQKFLRSPGLTYTLITIKQSNRSAVEPFRCLAAMLPEGSTRAGILPGCPSLGEVERQRSGSNHGPSAPALATDSAVPYQATWSETPEYILHVTTAASRDQPPYRVEAHE
ncbi:hypothetical protein T265_04092 [Opisthorchis viverrini]|uniref:Uncharacterized protein n=1 Tax=Opisthorchis viverrini TaxID=6198 RepID=A0A074ZQ88_OPIVI|nr:hypothetical protein T265_04092 [Opisthorchis viverrini]KER29246.1 hypothetical protein T265_04092 [Opisthorchis viverrini]